jgi:transcriptional regulator NrdR family protein
MPREKRTGLEKDGAKLGLSCRACGCQHLRVVYLRRLPKGQVLRRRACRHCGKRVSTRELQF